MMFTAQMTQLFAVVLRKDRERVTEALLREGVLQFVSTSEIQAEGAGQLSDKGPEGALGDVSDLRERIEGVLHTIGIIPSAPTETDLENRLAVDIEKEKSRLDKIDAQRDGVRERQRTIQQEILKLEDIKRQVELYGIGLTGVKLPARQSMLSLQAGKLSLSGVRHLEAGLEGLPALHIGLGQDGDEAYHLLLSMKRDQEQIDRVLSSVGWSKVELPSELLTAKKDLFEGLSEKLSTLTQEQKKLQSQVANLIKKGSQHLRDVWVSLRVQELSLRIEANFESSTRAVAFAGWLPASKRAVLTDGITEASEGRCYLEWHEAGSEETIGEEVPVRLDNPKV
ncbi:MAG: V-type ATP synthase subunit I, partial [Planctomycetota bacterium]